MVVYHQWYWLTPWFDIVYQDMSWGSFLGWPYTQFIGEAE